MFSETPFRNAEIYYRDVDPPNFAEYSHNPYSSARTSRPNVGPNQMWTMDVMLANPDQWAMVTAGSLDSPQRPNFHCVLAVDGKVVVDEPGPQGRALLDPQLVTRQTRARDRRRRLALQRCDPLLAETQHLGVTGGHAEALLHDQHLRSAVAKTVHTTGGTSDVSMP